MLVNNEEKNEKEQQIETCNEESKMVKRVNIKVDFVDYDVILILSNLDHTVPNDAAPHDDRE